MEKRIYTAESVTNGHPDKLADLIADNILDACLAQDKDSRVAVEVMLSSKNVFVVGEITTLAKLCYEEIVIDVIGKVGYKTDDLNIVVEIHEQSVDICQAVSKEEQGAGDQGIVYGYACDETKNFMPLAVNLAHALTDELTLARENGTIQGILPDGKSQVSIEYNNGVPNRIVSIVVSCQHEENRNLKELEVEIKKNIINKVFYDFDLEDTEILINPSGRFVLGGFEADSGVTGRKLMVDSYGGIAHHGGGAYSGKDPSKVDRSGAYFARYVAKNIIKAGLAEMAEVTISYAIGKAEPTSVDINTFYTGAVSDDNIKKAVLKVFDFRPKAIIDNLGLLEQRYCVTASGGHFGKKHFPWESTNKAEELKKAVLED